MRIEQIAIRGLASLRDLQPVIHLTGEAFAGAGLVAVTGPTGAGKSTIFDAVCLPLFDATPRLLGRHADPRELLSRGATSARVEIIFQLNDGARLQAIWSTKRAYDKLSGELQPSQLEIRDPDQLEDPGNSGSGKVLASGKKSVLAFVQERLGLSFDQFRAVAMLSQGEFARFIQAAEKDKAELLEKLTGTDLYARISKRAHERHQRLKLEIQTKEARLGAIALLTDEQIAERKAGIEIFNQEFVKSNTALKSVHAQQNWWKRLVQLNEQKIATEAALMNAQSAWETAATERARLLIAKQATQFADPLSAYDAALSEQKRLKQTLATAELGLPHAESNASEIQTALLITISRLQALHANAQKEAHANRGLARITTSKQTELGSFVRERMSTLEQKKRNLLAIESSHKQLLQATESAKNDEAILSGASIAVTTKQNIYNESKEIFDLQLKNGDEVFLTTRINFLETAIAIADLEASETAALLDIKTSLAHLEQQRQIAIEAHVKLEAALCNTKLAVDSQIAGRDALVQIAKVHEFRHLLKDDEPCPLCGSLHHPGTEEESGLVAASELQLSKLQKVEKELLAESQKATVGLQKISSQVQLQQAAYDERLRQIEKRLQSWNSLRAHLPQLTSEITGHLELRKQLANERQNVTAITTARHAHDLAQKSLQTTREAHAQAQLTIEQRKTNIKTASYNHQKAQESLSEIEAQLNSINERLHLGVAQLAEEIGETPPVLIAEDEWISRLATRAETWTNINHRTRLAAELHVRSNQILGKLPAGSVIPPASEQPITDNHLSYLSSTFSTIVTKYEEASQVLRDAQVLVKSTNQELIDSTKRCELNAATLQEALIGSPFPDVPALRAAKLPHSDFTKLEQKLLALEKQRDQGQILTQKAVDEHSQHLQESALAEVQDTTENSDLAMARINSDQNTLMQQRDTATNTRAKLQAELATDIQQRTNHALEHAELEQLRTAMRPWADLDSLIGHSNGDTFRQVAQALVLDQLLTLANQRLDAIAPRYALGRQQLESNPHSLSLIVIDHDQADESRSIATLSGGETFLVSLALALALADLKRGHLHLGTLFIDEGFGTLDGDTLDQAMSVLERLQAEQGTQILLISHVGALQDRVRHQIRVVPRGAGISRLQLLSPDGDVTANMPQMPDYSVGANQSQVSIEDAQEVLRILTEAGQPISTIALRKLLEWEKKRFDKVMEFLVSNRQAVRPTGSKSLELAGLNKT